MSAVESGEPGADQTQKAEVGIRFLPRHSGQPKHLLATAELVLHLGGTLPDMKVTGFALWRGESERAVTLTLPARQTRTGDYYCFRTVSGQIKDLVQFKREVIKAYHAWAAVRDDEGHHEANET